MYFTTPLLQVRKLCSRFEIAYVLQNLQLLKGYMKSKSSPLLIAGLEIECCLRLCVEALELDFQASILL